MQGSTGRAGYQVAWALFGLAVVSVVVLAVLGQVPGAAAGWVRGPTLPALRVWRRVRRRPRCWVVPWAALGGYLRQSWRPALVRSLLLWGLWTWGGRWGPAWLWLAPWGLWLWQGCGVGWPAWRRGGPWRWVQWGLWQGQRLLLVWYLGLALGQVQAAAAPWLVGLSCLVDVPPSEVAAVQVNVERQADGSYQASLNGHFTLTVAGDQPFRLRLLVLCLSLLDVPGAAGAAAGRGMGGPLTSASSSWQPGLRCPSLVSAAGWGIGRPAIGRICSACTAPRC